MLFLKQRGWHRFAKKEVSFIPYALSKHPKKLMKKEKGVEKVKAKRVNLMLWLFSILTFKSNKFSN